MHGNFIFMHESGISMHKNKKFAPIIFMRGIFIHEILGAKFFIFMHGNLISMHENEIFISRFFLQEPFCTGSVLSLMLANLNAFEIIACYLIIGNSYFLYCIENQSI